MTRRKVLLAAAIVGLLGVLSGCTDSARENTAPDPADPSRITDVVREYFDAYNAGDVAGLNATSCSAAQREQADVPPGRSQLTDVDDPIVEGWAARVPVELTIFLDGFDPTPSRTQILLVDEDGRWGVCMLERPVNS